MSYQSSSEEQMWALKEFLAKTWKIIVAIIVIGLLAYYGWSYYQSNQVKKSDETSTRYSQLLTQLDESKSDSVKELVDFAKQNNNIYGVFADLQSAKFYVEVLKDYAGAQSLLTDALTKTKSEPLQSIIHIRIARLQYQQGQYKESFESLDKVTGNAWIPYVNDVRGDVYVKLERYAEAVDAYNVALSSPSMVGSKENIKMKLNQAEYLKAKQSTETEKKSADHEAEQGTQLKKAEAEENKN